MQEEKRNNCRDFSGHATVCAQCGYRFIRGETALWVNETKDVVHRDCFADYVEDNLYEFTEEMNF
jgi:hypothetical protein